MDLYIDVRTRYIPNMKTCSVHQWNQNRNKAENECSSLQYRYLFICLFDYKALLLWVKDRPCLRMAIPAYCFSIFGTIFGVLLCLLIKKLILVCDTIWQSMRKTFPNMDKEEIFLSWELHIDTVWIFYTFSLDLKASI